MQHVNCHRPENTHWRVFCPYLDQVAWLSGNNCWQTVQWVVPVVIQPWDSSWTYMVQASLTSLGSPFETGLCPPWDVCGLQLWLTLCTILWDDQCWCSGHMECQHRFFRNERDVRSKQLSWQEAMTWCCSAPMRVALAAAVLCVAHDRCWQCLQWRQSDVTQIWEIEELRTLSWIMQTWADIFSNKSSFPSRKQNSINFE